MSGKKYNDASERLDRQKLHDPTEALGLVKEMASANFDEAVDIAVGLGVEAVAVGATPCWVSSTVSSPEEQLRATNARNPITITDIAR